MKPSEISSLLISIFKNYETQLSRDESMTMIFNELGELLANKELNYEKSIKDIFKHSEAAKKKPA